MANKNPNTGPLLRSIEQKKEKTFQKVDKAIKEMVKQRLKVNFNSVAEFSGVSKSFLYNYSDVRSRIETLRKQEEGLKTPRQVKREMTEQSKDVIIASLRKRTKSLEAENRELKERLKVDWGTIYNEID